MLIVDELVLSTRIEELLVERNPRHMQTARAALQPGYILRAARQLYQARGSVIIGTGFPVTGTFETDGPVGAMALYEALAGLGAQPLIACGPPLSRTLGKRYEVLELTAAAGEDAHAFAQRQLRSLQPAAVVSIERPGLAADGCYYNMRGEDISELCYAFDPFFAAAHCPTIAIGDGGNEIGMGNIAGALEALDINASVTRCDELVVADVSNWGSYGLIALLSLWHGRDFLGEFAPEEALAFLSQHGSVDGVTGANTLTEDGLAASEGLALIDALRTLLKFAGDA